MGGEGVQICEGGLNPLADFVPRGSKSRGSKFAGTPMFVPLGGTPTWRLHAKLYKFG